MRPSELKYITQEIIDKGGINVTSPEMLEEARRYNMSVVKNGAIKHRTNVVTGIWYVLHIPFLLLALCLYLSLRTLADFFNYESGAFSAVLSTAALLGLFVGIAGYLGLLGYYIIFKFQRDPKLVFLCSAPLLFTLASGSLMMAAGGFTLIVNMIMSFWYTKTDEKLSAEAGYPAFVRLAVTTVNSGEDNIQKITYEGIKERTRHLRSDDEDFL